MQPISDDIKNYADNIKNLRRCREVWMDPEDCENQYTALLCSMHIKRMANES